MINLKKTLLGSILLAVWLSMNVNAQEINPYKYDYPVIFNGEYLEFDQAPVNIQGRVLVPIALIFQEIGAEVTWNEKDQSVRVVRDEVNVGIYIGERTYYRNGNQYTMDVPAQVINGRTMVPLAVVAECFGCDISWNQETSTVTINYTPPVMLMELNTYKKSSYYINFIHSRYGVTRPDAMYSHEEDGFTTVSLIGDSLQAIHYSNDIDVIKTIDLTMELPIYAGSYQGDDCYYLLFGQENPSEIDTTTVFAVAKYDLEWNKISVGKVSGGDCGTVTPFRSGGASMTEFQGKLFVHTSKLRYASIGGINHQSNLTLVFDTETMAFISPSDHPLSGEPVIGDFFNYDNWELDNYVSHSFDQYVDSDEKEVIFLDHGDSSPRALTLTVYNGTTSKEIELCSIPGTDGQNYTGVSIGGVAVTSSTFLATATRTDLSLVESFLNSGMGLMNAIPSDEKRNPYLYVVDRQTGEVKELLLDNSSELLYVSSAPRIVPLENETYCLIWTNYPSPENSIASIMLMDVRYIVVDQYGNFLSDVQVNQNVVLSCHMIPIYHQGQVCWFVDNNDLRTLNKVSLP